MGNPSACLRLCPNIGLSLKGPTVRKHNIWVLPSKVRAFQVVILVKSPPAVQATQEMWVQSLGWEDPLQKEMAPHSSILAWKIPGMEEPGGLLSMGSHRVGHK